MQILKPHSKCFFSSLSFRIKIFSIIIIIISLFFFLNWGHLIKSFNFKRKKEKKRNVWCINTSKALQRLLAAISFFLFLQTILGIVIYFYFVF